MSAEKAFSTAVSDSALYEQYLEFSLNGYVVLTLADDHFEEGRVGMYVESATIRVDELQLEVYESPSADGYPYDLPKH